MAYATRPSDETNPISDFGGHQALQVDHKAGRFALSDRRVVKIVRLRLIGACREYPWWDVSYCYGRLDDGRLVNVDLGTDRIRRSWRPHLVELCKQANRYGVSLGIIDAVSELPG